MPRDAFVLVFAADHEAGDVLQEHQRDLALRTQFDEMRAFLGGFREQDAIVGNDTDGAAFHMGETADQRLAKARLEFVEAAAIDHPHDDFADVIGRAQIGGDNAQHLGRIIGRVFGRLPLHIHRGRAVQPGHGASCQGQRVGVILGQIVGNT